MGRSQIAVPRFGIRLRSPPPRVNHISYIVKPATPEGKDPRIPRGDGAEDRGSAAAGNRVMVVVDSSIEAEGALDWALSHTVQNHRDCIVLLRVVKPFSRGELDEINRRTPLNYLRNFSVISWKASVFYGGRAWREVQPQGR